MKGTLHTDGACFGNPGPMGLGIVLEYDGKTVEKSVPHGDGTNNIAEYSALIKGMQLAKEKGVSELEAYMDSELVVRQVNGEWRVKDATLQELHATVQRLRKDFDSFSLNHVRRERNARADALSKAAAMRN